MLLDFFWILLFSTNDIPVAKSPLPTWRMFVTSLWQSCSWDIAPGSAQDYLDTAAMGHVHWARPACWGKGSFLVCSKNPGLNLQPLHNSRHALELHKYQLFREENGTEKQDTAFQHEKTEIHVSWVKWPQLRFLFIALNVFLWKVKPACTWFLQYQLQHPLSCVSLVLQSRGDTLFTTCFQKLDEL